MEYVFEISEDESQGVSGHFMRIWFLEDREDSTTERRAFWESHGSRHRGVSLNALFTYHLHMLESEDLWQFT